MSLKIWLPLNNSLVNQGTLNTGITTSGGAYVTGKVTSKALATGSLTLAAAQADKVMSNTGFSWAGWVMNIKDNPESGNVSTSIFNTAASPRRFSLFMYPKYSTLHLSTSTNDATTNNLSFTIENFFPKNEWVHLVITYGNGKLKTYKNGSLVRTNNATFSVTNWNSQTIRIIETNGNRYLNDVRLYDHCLSLKEVKQLARGLMVHYPLSRPGDNLLVNSNFYNGVTNWTAAGSTRSVVTDSNYGSVLQVKASTANTGRVYNSVTGMFTSGETYTYSFLAKADSSVTVKPSRANVDNGPTVTLTTSWNRYSGTITATATSNAFSLYIGNTTSTIQFAYIKLEKGSKATPWIPNMTDIMFKNMSINTVSPSGYLVNTSAVNVGSASSGTQYMYATFTPIGGGNFQPRIHRVRFKVTVLAGSVSTVTVLFYNLSTSTGNTRIDAPIVNGYVDIFITPSSAIPNLLIYAGVAGATANKHILIENVLVYDQFNVSDTSGYNNNGSAINIKDVNSDTARYLASYPFNGSNSYIRCLDPIKSSATEFTISFWVYLNNISTTMCLWNGRTIAGASVALFIVNSNMYFDDSTRTTVTTELTANNWIHIVGTWKSGGKKILYVNGISKSSVNAGTLSKSNNYATIGLSSASDATPSGNPFNGKISDVRIYATALSADDVKELYNVGASIDKNGNMHCYELIEN